MSEYYVDPAAGGDDDGSDWANAWTNPQSAFDAAVAGDIVYCRGTYTFPGAAQIDIDTNAGTNAAGFIKFIGCNAGGSVDGTRFVMDANGESCDVIAVATNMHMIWFENIECKNASGAGHSGIVFNGNCDGWVMINCSFHDNTYKGLEAAYYMRYALLFRCVFYGNQGGIYMDYATSIAMFCRSYNNTSFGVESAESTFLGCLIYGNDYGVRSIYARIIGCVVDKNTSWGIKPDNHANQRYVHALMNRITNHSGTGDIGIDCNTEPVVAAFNYFENNDTNIANNTLFAFVPVEGGTTESNQYDQGDTNQGYTDLTPGSEDYNLRSDATLRRTAISIPLT